MQLSGWTRLALLLVLLCACAGRRLEPQLASSADGTSYGLRYPDQLARSTQRFAADRKQAHELTASLPIRADELARTVDRALLSRIVEQADAAGKSRALARAKADERVLRAFWEEERGAIAARTANATEKPLAEANCGQVQLQGPISYALRDGFDKQLERRLHADSEAERTLEQHKAQLAPGTFAALSRFADDLASASQLVHVALLEDVKELDRLLSEQREVDATLGRALDEERVLQSRPLKPNEQRASQERVVLLEKMRAAIGPNVQRAEAELRDADAQLERARDEYDGALDAIRTSVRDQTATKT